MDKPSLKYAVIGGLGLSFFVFMVLSLAVTHEFKDLKDSFLKSYYKTYPVNATWIGVHEYDGSLTDYSRKALDSRASYLKNISEQIESLDFSRLNQNDHIDYEILLDAIRSEQFELLELKEATWNPLVYMGELGFAFESLIGFEFASASERANTFLSRLNETPNFLFQAEALLDSCPQIHLNTAIRQWDGVMQMLDSGIDLFLEDIESDLAVKIKSASKIALASLTQFKAFLENKLKEPHKDFRLGSDLYEHKLSHILRENLSAKTVLEKAEEFLKITDRKSVV